MIKKFALLLICGVMAMFQSRDSKIYENIQTSFNDSYQIEVTIEGNITNYDKDDQQYYTILALFNDMIEDSHQMPALSVSLDDETKQAKNEGVWLEFKFDNINYNSDMPFSALLVEVNKDYYGFNVIRKYDDKYEGRTFYINLENKNMDKLYNYLSSLKRVKDGNRDSNIR